MTRLRLAIKRWQNNQRRTGGWGGVLYLLPALMILLIFEIWPILFNLYISLWRWDVGPLKFVGLANYQRLFGEGFVTRDYNDQLAVGEVLHSLIVTIYYVLGRVPITIVLGAVCAAAPRAQAAIRAASRPRAMVETRKFFDMSNSGWDQWAPRPGEAWKRCDFAVGFRRGTFSLRQ